jgi:hypothetical protein
VEEGADVAIMLPTEPDCRTINLLLVGDRLCRRIVARTPQQQGGQAMRRTILILLGMIVGLVGLIAAKIPARIAAWIATRADRRPWENRRGQQTIDYNNNLLLIRASIDDVAHALADRTERWERDVVGREIILGQFGAFVFRLRGHSWTVVIPEVRPELQGWALLIGISEQTRALSGLLKTRAIYYRVGDTSATVGYELYENGELLEKLSATEGGSPDDTFSSRLRDLNRRDIRNIWRFTDRFLVDQDAFEPGISFQYFIDHTEYRRRQEAPRPGDRVRIVNDGFSFWMPDGSRSQPSIPPIERVDYLVLRPIAGQ